MPKEVGHEACTRQLQMKDRQISELDQEIIRLKELMKGRIDPSEDQRRIRDLTD